MSIKEMRYKLQAKGLDKKIIDKYIDNNYDELKQYEEKCREKIKARKSALSEEEIKRYLYRKGYKIDE